MQTNNRFAPDDRRFGPDDRLPVFLSGRDDEREPRESAMLLNTSIVVMTVTFIGIAITLSMGNPLKVFTDIKASVFDVSSTRPDTARSTTTTRSIPSMQAVPPAATDTPTRNEIPAAADSAEQAETGAPSTALLGQFESWAARQDGRTQDEPTQDQRKVEPQIELVRPKDIVRPMDETAARGSQDADAPVRSVQRHRAVRPAQAARAEARSARNAGARARRAARVEARPVQDARAQVQPVQTAQPPAPTQSFGWRQ